MNIIVGSHGVITIQFKGLSSGEAAMLVTSVIRSTIGLARMKKVRVRIASLALTPDREAKEGGADG